MTALRRVLPIAALLAVFWPTSVSPTLAAQLQSGTIIGTAHLGDGSPAPGVTVTVSGGWGTRNTVTQERGDFTVRGLPPGEYTLKMEAPGFDPMTQSVTVPAGGTARADARFQFKGVGEQIVVTGQPTGAGTTVSQTELQQIPIGGDPWTILQQTPGVLTDRINVGGNEAGQQSAYVFQGTPPSSSVWSVDGVIITDMAELGRSPAYYNFDSFEQVQITNGGADAGRAVGGVVNVVLKSGTNEFHGSSFLYHGNGVKARAFGGGVPQRNTLFTQPTSLGGSLGGPIVKDRAWVFGHYGATSINRTAFAADGATPADFDGQRYEGKLTLSPFKGHRLIGSYINVDNERLGSGAGALRAASSTTRQETSDRLVSVNYQGILTDSFFLEGQYSRRELAFVETPRDGVPVIQNRIWSGSYLNFNSERPQTEFRADASSFFNTGTLSHELRFGASSQQFRENGRLGWKSDGFTQLGGAFPVRIFTPINNWRIDRSSTAFYVSNTLSSRNLTLDLGLRYDRQTSENLESQRDANPVVPALLPALGYPGGDAVEWHDVSPRVGVTYAVGAEGNLLLQASYARYVDQLGTGIARGANELATVPNSFTYGFAFNDRNGDNSPGAGEEQGTGLIVNTPGGNTIIDSSLRSPNVEEYSIGVSRRLGSRGVLRADVYKRSVTDYIDDVPLVNDAGSIRLAVRDDYFTDRILTGADYAGQSYQTPVFRLRPGVTPAGRQMQNGDRETEYLGATVSFTKSLANRWMLRGNVHLNNWTWSVPDASVGDPNDLVGTDDNDGAPVAPEGGFGKSGLFMNSRWSFSVNGLYQVAPSRPWGFDVAGTVDGRQGYLTPASATVQGADGVTRQIQVGDSDGRLPKVTMVNLQISKAFSIKKAGVALGADILNATNAGPILQADRNVTSLTHRQTLEELSRRVFRIVARLRW